MSLIKNFTKINDVLFFNPSLDNSQLYYDANFLEDLFKAETSHFWFKTRKEKICKTFASFVKKENKILEIGTGTGFVAQGLKEQGYKIEPSDLHSKSLFYLQKKGFKTLYQFDLFDPPFHEEFDVICLFDVLEHLQDEKQALHNLKKMLKPQGLIILTVPAHQWLWNRDDVLANHQKRYKKKELNYLFESSGFSVIEIKYFFIFILPLLLIRKWLKNPKTTKNQPLQIKMPGFINKPLYWLTKLEFALSKWLPNIAGGSLIAVASKKT